MYEIYENDINLTLKGCIQKNLNKQYLLECDIRRYAHYSVNRSFFFDTKESLVNFIKNGSESIKPENIKIKCVFEINKIDIEL